MQKSSSRVDVPSTTCHAAELDSLFDLALQDEPDAPLPAEYTKQFKTEKKNKKGKTAKIVDSAGELDFDAAVASWIGKYMSESRSDAKVAKRVCSSAYHGMESWCRSRGLSKVFTKEQAKKASRAGMAKWRAAVLVE